MENATVVKGHNLCTINLFGSLTANKHHVLITTKEKTRDSLPVGTKMILSALLQTIPSQSTSSSAFTTTAFLPPRVSIGESSTRPIRLGGQTIYFTLPVTRPFGI